MRLRLLNLLLLAAALGHSLVAVCPMAAAQGTTGPCESADEAQENACLAARAARGEYQHIIDELETQEIGLKPYQQYFLGSSYFALAARTGARSLRCFWNDRAASLLESFLEERQQVYATRQSFGNAEEMKYSYVAARILDSARAASTGCEQAGESLGTLERHGRTYLSAAVKDLFFNYGSSGAQASMSSALRASFDAKLGHVQQAVRKFVADASRMETNFGLTKLELAAAQRDLSKVVDTVNRWRTGAIVRAYDGPGGALRFSFGPPLQELLGEIASRQQGYRTLAASGGALGDAKADVDRFMAEAGASNMADYQAKRAALAATAQRLAVDLATVGNHARSISRTDAVARVSTPPAQAADGIEARWSAIERAWRERKPGCSVNPNKWYCQ
jgi:hypothetical protein